MLASTGPTGDPMVTPSTCWYISPLKHELNTICHLNKLGEFCSESIGGVMSSEWYRCCTQSWMVSSRGTLVKRFLMANEHTCLDSGMVVSRISRAQENESLMVWWLNLFTTGFRSLASHWAVACWGEPLTDKISHNGICTWGTPWILEHVDPVGRVSSYTASVIWPSFSASSEGLARIVQGEPRGYTVMVCTVPNFPELRLVTQDF